MTDDEREVVRASRKAAINERAARERKASTALRKAAHKAARLVARRARDLLRRDKARPWRAVKP